MKVFLTDSMSSPPWPASHHHQWISFSSSFYCHHFSHHLHQPLSPSSFFFFLVFCLYLWQVLLQVWQPPPFSVFCHPFQFSLRSSSPRLPSSVALLLPLPLLPSSFPSITVWYKLFPLIMCPSHFFFIFFSVLNSSLSTPISHVILAILLHSHISNRIEHVFFSLPSS